MDYLLCTSPRVGSNLLSTLLHETRAAGRPDEFFCPTRAKDLVPKLLGIPAITTGAEMSQYYDALRETYRVGEWFGVKAHFNQFRWGLEQGFELSEHFPDRFLYLNRGDLVGQAISWVRAAQTGAWISKKPERREPRFDPHAIRKATREILTGCQAWESFFQTVGIEPYRLSYERLCADFVGEVEGILRYLDVDPASVDLEDIVERSTEYMQRQRDDTNDRWREKYDQFVKQRAQEQSRIMCRAS